jgi:Fe2+ transport system protein B
MLKVVGEIIAQAILGVLAAMIIIPMMFIVSTVMAFLSMSGLTDRKPKNRR